ncbi:MAG: endonuclease NucS [Acidobacteriota bacterium]|nr:endonuclease NucS [Acidobacteriota bacterium]
MTEREMEDLIWEHPDKFLNEPLKQFQRQPSSGVGRADLIFIDRVDRLLVIELKLGILGRGAVPQLVDYFGMFKSRFPGKSVELMIIANGIPPERRVSCEQFHIEPVEISQKKFRDVAEEVGYVFESERANANPSSLMDRVPVASNLPATDPQVIRDDFPHAPSKTEKAWYYWRGENDHGYFLAFVNAKGSCSMRRFKADGGAFLKPEYKSGDYQASFLEYLKSAVTLYVSRQPNLERDCKDRLPDSVISELRRQVGSANK